MQRIQQAAGLLLARGPEGALVFKGTCFSFRRPEVFLTAHHCVAGLELEDLVIGLPVLGNALNGNLPIRAVVPHPEADVSLLFVNPPAGAMPYSMASIDWAADWGERVVTFGYPEDTAPHGVMPTPRMSQGNVQRFFDYNDGRGAYCAIELSFPAPEGLSGSPVSRTQDTGAVIGIVTANHDALSYRGGFEVSDATGTYRAVERDVIRYGIAVFLPELMGWIDETIAANVVA